MSQEFVAHLRESAEHCRKHRLTLHRHEPRPGMWLDNAATLIEALALIAEGGDEHATFSGTQCAEIAQEAFDKVRQQQSTPSEDPL